MKALGDLSYTVRPFDKSRDYADTAELHNATFSDRPVTAQELETSDKAANPDPKYIDEDFVVELGPGTDQDGRLIAHLWYGHWSGMYHPQKFYFSLNVHPDFRRHGIGSELYQRMLAGLAPYDPVQVTNVAFDNQTEGLAFLQKRGFVERMRFWESYLDVAEFDPTPYSLIPEKMAAQGIEIRNEAELSDDPGFERKLYEMLNEIVQDVPTTDEFTPEPFERFVETRRLSINRIPEAYFIAIDTGNGRYAGTSSLWQSQAADYLKTGLTGVRREYRRKSIALALKLRGIEYARSVGAPGIRTDNESGNRPMLSINEMLGYRRGTAELAMLKTF